MEQFLFRDTVTGRNGTVAGQKDAVEGRQVRLYWKKVDVSGERGHGQKVF